MRRAAFGHRVAISTQRPSAPQGFADSHGHKLSTSKCCELKPERARPRSTSPWSRPTIRRSHAHP